MKSPRPNIKPDKPSPEYPLYAHNTGRWAKKVQGKLYYFGPWEKPEVALDNFNKFQHKHLGTMQPDNQLSIGELCQQFLSYKQHQLEAGELAPRTLDRYKSSSELLKTHLGESRPLTDLTPSDFLRLRSVMAEKWGPVALGNEIQMVRTLFRFADESGFVDRPIRFGPAFRKPTARVLRQVRAAIGPRVIQPKDIKDLLQRINLLVSYNHLSKISGANLTAMTLLGINGGLGNTDLGELPIRSLDLDGGWINYPRIKTGVSRRVPIWPETVAALRTVLRLRPKPRKEGSPLVFIGPRGQDYATDHGGSRVGKLWNKVRQGEIGSRTFYDLRRTFQTVGEESGDLVAVQAIMGHAPSGSDMSAVYRQYVTDSRLKAVVDTVHRWLYNS